MITSSGVSSSFILNNCAKWELLWSPLIGKEKESQEGESFERFQARSDLKACATLTLGRCLQLKPVLCLLILLHTPNTMLLLRKRIRIALRGVSPAPPQDSAAPPPPAPPQGCKWYCHCCSPGKRGLWCHTEEVHFSPGQHHQAQQLPGVIWQVWVATENFIFPLFATVAVHSPVA